MRVKIILAVVIVLSGLVIGQPQSGPSMAQSPGPLQVPLNVTWDSTYLYMGTCLDDTAIGYWFYLAGPYPQSLQATRDPNPQPGCMAFYADYTKVWGGGSYQVHGYLTDIAGIVIYDVAPSPLDLPYRLALPVVPVDLTTDYTGYPTRPTQAPYPTRPAPARLESLAGPYP